MWAGNRAPAISELVICPRCGRDNSVPIPVSYRIGDYLRRFQRRLKKIGWSAALTTTFRTEREIASEKTKKESAGHERPEQSIHPKR